MFNISLVQTHFFEEIRLETREKSNMGMLCWYPLSPYTHGKKKNAKKSAHFFFANISFLQGFYREK